MNFYPASGLQQIDPMTALWSKAGTYSILSPRTAHCPFRLAVTTNESRKPPGCKDLPVSTRGHTRRTISPAVFAHELKRLMFCRITYQTQNSSPLKHIWHVVSANASHPFCSESISHSIISTRISQLQPNKKCQSHLQILFIPVKNRQIWLAVFTIAHYIVETFNTCTRIASELYRNCTLPRVAYVRIRKEQIVARKRCRMLLRASNISTLIC